MRWAHLPEFNALPDDWRIVPFSELAEVTAGQSPPSSTYNSTGQGLPFLQGNADFGDMFPRPTVWCTDPAKTCRPGSTLISVRAPVGEVNRADREYAIGRGLAAIRAREVDSDFLYYGMLRWRACLQRVGQGTTYDAVTSRHFRQMMVALPRNLAEQRAIARLLAAADEAIARSRYELEVARRLKTALMQELFTKGMPGRHSSLTTTKWLTMPSTWKAETLGNLAGIRSGFTMGRDLFRYTRVSLPYVTVINVQEGFFDLSAISTAEVKESELEAVTLRPGDVLMTEGGDRDKLGRGAIWEGQIDPCAYQNHIFRIRFRDDTYNPRLFHFLLQSWTTKRYFYAHAKQTSNLCTINSRELKRYPIGIPEPEEQAQMLELLDSMEAAIQALAKRHLSESRVKASLLQNLLTGQVRVHTEVAP